MIVTTALFFITQKMRMECILSPPHPRYFSKKTKNNPPPTPKQMASPLWQFVAWSQFLELSNKSQTNSEHNGKADRHLTLTVPTEAHRQIRESHSPHGMSTECPPMCHFLVGCLPHKQQAPGSRNFLAIPGSHRLGCTLNVHFNCFYDCCF